MSDYSSVSVGQLVDLLQSASDALQTVQGAEAASCRERLREFDTALDGNRRLMKEQIGIAIGAASMCWSTPEGAGEFDSRRAAEIVDNLMWNVDSYADALPLIRHLNQLSIASEDPVEILSQAFYEVSARIGESVGDHTWAAAPDDIKEVIRQTVDQLVEGGLISPPPVRYTVEDGNRIHAGLQREFTRAMSDLGFPDKKPPEAVAIPVPPDYHFPSGGMVLPPDIPMPAGFQAENCGHPRHIKEGIDCRVQEVES